MTGSVARDKQLAEKLTRWEPEAWDEFRRRYDTRILRVAVKWCGSSCRSDCPGAGSGVRYKPTMDIICGDAHDGYVFIVHSIVKRLNAYRGECSMDTWLHPLLDPETPRQATAFNYHKLFADYLRHKHKRVQVPACLKSLSGRHQKLFTRLAYGDSLDDAAVKSGMASDQAEAAREQISEILQKESYGLYWQYLGASAAATRPISLDAPFSDDEQNQAIDPPDSRPDPHMVTEVRRCTAILRQCIRAQSDTDRALLALRYGHTSPPSNGTNPEYELAAPLNANQIARVFAALGHSDLITEQRIFVRLRTLRQRLVQGLKKSLGDTVAVTESRMDSILDEWGTSDDERARVVLEQYFALQTKLGELHPSNTN